MSSLYLFVAGPVRPSPHPPPQPFGDIWSPIPPSTVPNPARNPPDPPNNNNNNNNRLAIGLAVGLGSLTVIVVSVMLLYFVSRRRSADRSNAPAAEHCTHKNSSDGSSSVSGHHDKGMAVDVEMISTKLPGGTCLKLEKSSSEFPGAALVSSPAMSYQLHPVVTRGDNQREKHD